ncbi:MAG: phosphoglycerate kinase, partial [Actinobacteria bacterium]|nr:phosphoglycerate kinase [Actinomycetota bacterium]
MGIKTLSDLTLQNKRVLLRCDLNVPIKDGVITDDGRIVASLGTIRKLLDAKCSIILIAHLGRPKGEPSKDLSLAPIAKRLGELLNKEVEFSNRAWLKKIRTNSPFVTLKMATSLDGRSAAPNGTSKWITTPQSRQDVAYLRSECDAIVTGTGTVISDNPRLSVRDVTRGGNSFAPVRVILGSRELSKELQIFNNEAETIQIKDQDLSNL